jgi:hypothetical protein
MKIIVKKAEAQVATINWNDSSFEVTQQAAVFESDDGETRGAWTLNLKKGSDPYPVGEYRLGDASFFYNGKYKRVEMAREVELVPLKAAAAIKAA